MKKNNEGTKSAQFMTDKEAEEIKDMSDSEMKSLLLGLRSSRVWIAILKYNFERLQMADHALHTLDPFKDPTSMARHQGIITGISDLPEMVSILEATRTPKEKDKEDEYSDLPE
jgi:hypothetical protein